jgi:hypothetical protein
MRLVSLFCACAAALLACGGSTTTLGSGSQGTSSVSGTAGGTPVPNTDQIGVSGTQVVNGATVAYVGVVITNVPGVCDVLQRHGNPPSATVLAVAVSEAGSTVSPGTYTIGTQLVTAATADYAAQNASCQETLSEAATGGTVTLTAASSALVEGSFDVTFASGDHLSGSFSAPICNVDIFANNTPSPCGS